MIHDTLIKRIFTLSGSSLLHNPAILFLLLFSIALPSSAQITANVDRQLLSEDETLRLIIEARGKHKDSNPDLTPLQQDFDVLGTSQSSRMQIINGQTDSSKQWHITLAPKRSGQLVIPPIGFDNQSTQAIKVQVIDAAELSQQTGNARPIFIEASVDKEIPHVQEQIILTVRLYHKVQIHNGSLSQPELSNALVEKIGDDKTLRLQKDGQLYDVIERRYALFPQQSGTLNIPALVFEGAIPDARQRQQNNSGFGRGFFSDPFDMLQPTRNVRIRSNALTLNVNKIPDNFKDQNWLPARSIRLQESWEPNKNRYEIGQPITRTITVIAEGLAASQIPELTIPSVDQVNIYPDQTARENRANDNGIVGLMQQKLALLPNAQGDVTLPEVKIPWWNTQTKRYETAHLPAKTLSFFASPSSTPSTKNPTPSINTNTENLDNFSSRTAFTTSTQGENYWPWVSAALLCLWISTLFLFLQERKKTSNRLNAAEKTQGQKQLSLNQLFTEVKAHCQTNNAKATRSALIQWARQKWQTEHIRSLGDIKSFCPNPRCLSAIDELNNALYTEQANWQGNELFLAFQAFNEQNQTHRENTAKQNTLPGLYTSA